MTDILDPILKRLIKGHLKTIQLPDITPAHRNNTIRNIWGIVNGDCKAALVQDPEINLLPILRTTMLDNIDDNEYILCVVGCIWYLSRDIEASPSICSPDIGLLPILLNFLSMNHPCKDFVTNALSNCCLNPVNHLYLIENNQDFLDLCYNDIRVNPTTHQTIVCIALVLHPKHRRFLLEYPFHEIMFHHLYSIGPDPEHWTNRYTGPDYWSLNYCVTISMWVEARDLFSSLISFDYFYQLLQTCEKIESLKAMLVLSNLSHWHTPNNYITKKMETLFDDYPRLLSFYIDVFTLAISNDTESQFYEMMVSRGFAYGILKLSELTFSLRILSTMDRNAVHLTNSLLILLPLLLKVMDSFIQNLLPFSVFVRIGIETAGGGGKDYHTIENILIMFIHLLTFHNMNGGSQFYRPSSIRVLERINQILSLSSRSSEERNIPTEIFRYCEIIKDLLLTSDI